MPADTPPSTGKPGLPWRKKLLPGASFRGVPFRVEVRDSAGGRRIVLHEFAKRDTPYGEDLGRRARAYRISGYVIGPNYHDQRDALIGALEEEGPGTLVMPIAFSSKSWTEPIQVVNDGFRVIERRERGGMAEIEMVFIERGMDVSTSIRADTSATVNSAANDAQSRTTQAAQNTLNNAQQATTEPGADIDPFGGPIAGSIFDTNYRIGGNTVMP